VKKAKGSGRSTKNTMGEGVGVGEVSWNDKGAFDTIIYVFRSRSQCYADFYYPYVCVCVRACVCVCVRVCVCVCVSSITAIIVIIIDQLFNMNAQ
jgi:hypothetical protein